MRSVFAVALLAAPGALAQVNTTFVAGLVGTLQSLNLTSLIGAVTTLANTTTGQSLLGALSTGAAYTILAPTNDAFAGVNPFFSNDPVWLGQAIAYHVIPQHFEQTALQNAPNASIFATALTDNTLVHLLQGRGQNIGLQQVGSQLQIANQNNVPSIQLNLTKYENVDIRVITTVVDLPPSISSLLTLPFLAPSLPLGQNITVLNAILGSSGLVPAIEASQSITVFAPIDSAFTAAVSDGFLPSNSTPAFVQSVLLNHVINGTLVYSYGPQTNYTSAGGQEITVGSGGLDDGSGGVVYYRGEKVADIVTPNIITQNGVMHLINVVLPPPGTKDAKAAAAAAARRATLRVFRA